MKLLRQYYSHIVMGVSSGVYWVCEHLTETWTFTKEYLLVPFFGLIFPKVWDKIFGKEEQCKIVLEPETRTRETNDPVTSDEQLEKQTRIQALIERLLEGISADRVIIHKFHNGGKFYTERCTQKMAVVYQASRYKYFKLDNEINGGDFNLEKMGSILKKVVDKRYLHLTIDKDKDKYQYTPYFQYLVEDGVEANHLRILRSGRDTYRNIGLLSIHFIKHKKKSINEREIMLVDKTVREIQLLLTDDHKGYPKDFI